MFTGLVECLGTVRSLTAVGAGRELVLAAPFAGELTLGDSVAINGCCLTVVECAGDSCRFQVGPETLSKTNLGGIVPGDRVNLERSLRAGASLGGHVVQGHVGTQACVGTLDCPVGIRRGGMGDDLVALPGRAGGADGAQGFRGGGRHQPDAGRGRSRVVQRRPDPAHARRDDARLPASLATPSTWKLTC